MRPFERATVSMSTAHRKRKLTLKTVYHFWMRIFSGLVPTCQKERLPAVRVGEGHNIQGSSIKPLYFRTG
jgi:hypothetical protein